MSYVPSADSLCFNSTAVDTTCGMYRSYGSSVRCFKNSYLSFPSLVSTTNESTTTTV
ncbi:hypothetical protein J5751_00920 [bacterium]|nr:hypothetical protein [bacterium]